MRLAHFLAIFFLAFFAFSLAKKRKSKADQAEPRFGGENVHKFQSGKCAFFCFFVPFQVENSIKKNFEKYFSGRTDQHGFPRGFELLGHCLW